MSTFEVVIIGLQLVHFGRELFVADFQSIDVGLESLVLVAHCLPVLLVGLTLIVKLSVIRQQLGVLSVGLGKFFVLGSKGL